MFKSTRIHIIIGLLFLGHALSAQELNCNVIVDAEQVQTSDRQIFTRMQKDIANFLNSRKWTDDKFKSEERISCNFVITLTRMPSVGTYQGQVQVQSTRPVYGTDYESMLFNFIDKEFNFSYTESQPMDYSDNAYIMEITSLLAFYAYVILGYDYDAFSKKGGEKFFERALNVANNAQGSANPAWKPGQNSFNRFALIDQLNSPQFLPFREVLYAYHMQGMDRFAEDADQARNQILAALMRLRQVVKVSPISVVMRTFFDSKADELINIYSEGSLSVRQNAVNLLSELDPTRTSKYRKAVR